MDDVGSGALLDPRAFGLGEEPLVQESIRAGATVVCFSGDKLLGGPQAGLIVGKREAIARVRRHPLARALRIDKASLAGLEVTLRHYQRGEAAAKIPVWRALATPLDALERRARSLAGTLASDRTGIVATRAAIGGGSLPGETIPSRALRVAPAPGESSSALARRLRRGNPPIVGRIEDDAVILDLRTVFPEEDAIVAAALRGADRIPPAAGAVGVGREDPDGA
jgi:L-seryl-tRNA(Ser) seleniumtransferase